MGKTITAVTDLQPDPRNANEGTARGLALLDTSVESFGGGRSILVDKHGVVIAGNKTLEVAVARGLGVTVVPTTGEELVVVQRRDLDLNDPKTRELAYLDNRAAELGLAWKPAQVAEDLSQGLQLNGMFTPDEIGDLLDELTPADEGDRDLNAFRVTPLTAKLTFKDELAHAQFQAWLADVNAHYPGETEGARVVAWVKVQHDRLARLEEEAT